MMRVCDDGHEEIVFDGRPSACPLCEAAEVIRELREKIEGVEADNADLRKEIETAEANNVQP